MPIYTFKDLNTGDEFTTVMTISEREEYLNSHPHIQQQLISAPAVGDSIRMGLKKPDNAFRDRLKEIKKQHSKGITKSTINTF